MNAEDQCALDIVRLGYATDDPIDKRRCLTFTARFDSLDGAQQAVRTIGHYNGFNGERVAGALASIAALPGALGSPGFCVGRESSPCVYVNQLPQADSVVEQVIAILRDAAADEADEVHDGGPGGSFGRTVRAWWD